MNFTCDSPSFSSLFFQRKTTLYTLMPQIGQKRSNPWSSYPQFGQYLNSTRSPLAMNSSSNFTLDFLGKKNVNGMKKNKNGNPVNTNTRTDINDNPTSTYIKNRSLILIPSHLNSIFSGLKIKICTYFFSFNSWNARERICLK